jgi:hypothetical protein
LLKCKPKQIETNCQNQRAHHDRHDAAGSFFVRLSSPTAASSAAAAAAFYGSAAIIADIGDRPGRALLLTTVTMVDTAVRVHDDRRRRFAFVIDAVRAKVGTGAALDTCGVINNRIPFCSHFTSSKQINEFILPLFRYVLIPETAEAR